jgi:RNA-directed DNA polymerase
VSGIPEGNTVARDKSRARRGHCGVKDPGHAWKLHAREPRDPVAIRSPFGADRWEKAMSYKTHVHGDRESHSGIVPAKRSNEGRGGPKEIVEGRPLTKENAEEPTPRRTPSRESGLSGLDRVRQAAKGDPKMRFTALLHHVNVELLRSSYYNLKRQAAAGVDQVTWQEYGDGLEEQLVDLHGRIHRGAYHAKASRRVWIA